MRLLIALGGNALLKRGQSLTAANQQINMAQACVDLANIALEHELIVVHGNGPQVGLLALQNEAYDQQNIYPLDVLGAETEGMIGYLLEQELSNALSGKKPVATLLTRVEIDRNDPAFQNPTKPIGPIYTEAQAQQLAQQQGWSIKPDGKSFRRVVASPKPKRIVEPDPIKWLLEKGTVLICAGGGGIPVYYDQGKAHGVEAVIDKDLCASMLAQELACNALIILTDVEAIYLNWQTPQQQAITQIRAQDIAKYTFAQGSMAPKVQAAVEFVNNTQKPAAIGSLKEIKSLLNHQSGSWIVP